MSEDHNIDRLYQESFKDFEVEAPKNAWQNIEKRLSQKPKRKILPLWYKVAGVAAVIAVLILVGSQWLIDVPVFNQENTIVEAPSENAEPLNSPISSKPSFQSSPINSISQNTIVSSDVSPEENKRSSISSEKANPNLPNQQNSYTAGMVTAFNEKTLSESTTGDNTSNTSTEQIAYASSLYSESVVLFGVKAPSASLIPDSRDEYSKPSQQSLIDVAEKIYEEENTTVASVEKKSWYVKPQLSPTFYGNMSSGSSIDESFAQNRSSGDINMTYGVNVAYQLSDKVKVRSGVNHVNLNYSTKDVYLVQGSAYSSLNNANLNSSFNASVLNSQEVVNLNTDGVLGRIPTETYQLQQQLGFIEIPMELEYKVLDKKVDINIIGGASTFLLSDNNLDLRSGSQSTSIGQANNLNDLSFSTNLALGFDFGISDKLMFNLEPTFKYQINTFQSGTTDFQPYFIGVYSGLIFKF